MTTHLNQGLSCPVLVPELPSWTMHKADLTNLRLASLPERELVQVDPLVVNLLVAKKIPLLADLDVLQYQRQVNELAEDFRYRYLSYWEESFRREPECYRNDVRFFQVGLIGQFLQQEVGIRYLPEQRGLEQVRYINPSDLFLNGVLDTYQGTCGNMAALALAIGWRMGWAVSLACVHSHYVLRHDDGQFVFNIELTAELSGGFSAPEDRHLIEDYDLPGQAMACGSDLKALTARERLGVFVWQRARHYRDLASESLDRQWLINAESDLMLSRYLFPNYRQTHRAAAFQLALSAEERFSPVEAGHLNSYAHLTREVRDFQSIWSQDRQRDTQRSAPSDIQDSAMECLAKGLGGIES